MVGSANTDFRSFMMDTNNAIYHEGADEFNLAYRTLLHECVLKNSRIARNLSAEGVFNKSTYEAYRQESIKEVRQVLLEYEDRYNYKFKDPMRENIVKHLTKMMDDVYEMTKSILASGGLDSKSKNFDRFFKPL